MLTFKLLDNPKEITALVKTINRNTSEEVLEQRISEMLSQNYECIGMFLDKELIGCSGLWYQTRHYSGRCVEPDHVVVLEEFRGKGYGKNLIDECILHAQNKGHRVAELNSYIADNKAHKFWEKLGFYKLGYHYQKKIKL